MKKKSLKGFEKTRHFLTRQKQRKVSDLEIIKTISQGSLIENDQGHNFLLGHLKVTVDLINHTLITVHPGDPATKSTKVLNKAEALKISELIEAHQNSMAPEEAEDEFQKYISDSKIKKLN